MKEKRKSIRVNVNNICEIKVQGLTSFEYCFLKDISILGVGFLSPEVYQRGEKADLTIVLDTKIIELEISVIATYYKKEKEGQNRYGAEIININDASKQILEEYVTNKIHESWSEKVKQLIK